jgi:predicted N-acetyltransferase YhbS
VELLDGPHQSDVALLHEIGEREASTLVSGGDRRDQVKVRLHQALVCNAAVLAALEGLPQRQGIGTALMTELLARADAVGWPFVLLLGDPDYYGRFDFEPSGPLGIVYPPVGAHSQHFQIRRVRDLDASAWRGSFTYCWELPRAG